MKSVKVIAGLLLSASMLNSQAFAAAENCTQALRISKMQAEDALIMEKTYEDIYKGARRDNLIATGLATVSSLAFSAAASGVILDGAATVSATTYILAVPGIALADSLVATYHITSPILIQVLGLGLQAVPMVYGLGHTAYRVMVPDQITHTPEQLKEFEGVNYQAALQGLEALQVSIAEEGRRIQDDGNYSQILDGLTLGSLDRNWTLRLYNNAKMASFTAVSKHNLVSFHCAGQ